MCAFFIDLIYRASFYKFFFILNPKKNLTPKGIEPNTLFR